MSNNTENDFDTPDTFNSGTARYYRELSRLVSSRADQEIQQEIQESYYSFVDEQVSSDSSYAQLVDTLGTPMEYIYNYLKSRDIEQHKKLDTDLSLTDKLQLRSVRGVVVPDETNKIVLFILLVPAILLSIFAIGAFTEVATLGNSLTHLFPYLFFLMIILWTYEVATAITGYQLTCTRQGLLVRATTFGLLIVNMFLYQFIDNPYEYVNPYHHIVLFYGIAIVVRYLPGFIHDTPDFQYSEIMPWVELILLFPFIYQDVNVLNITSGLVIIAIQIIRYTHSSDQMVRDKTSITDFPRQFRDEYYAGPNSALSWFRLYLLGILLAAIYSLPFSGIDDLNIHPSQYPDQIVLVMAAVILTVFIWMTEHRKLGKNFYTTSEVIFLVLFTLHVFYHIFGGELIFTYQHRMKWMESFTNVILIIIPLTHLVLGLLLTQLLEDDILENFRYNLILALVSIAVLIPTLISTMAGQPEVLSLGYRLEALQSSKAIYLIPLGIMIQFLTPILYSRISEKT